MKTKPFIQKPIDRNDPANLPKKDPPVIIGRDDVRTEQAHVFKQNVRDAARERHKRAEGDEEARERTFDSERKYEANGAENENDMLPTFARVWTAAEIVQYGNVLAKSYKLTNTEDMKYDLRDGAKAGDRTTYKLVYLMRMDDGSTWREIMNLRIVYAGK